MGNGHFFKEDIQMKRYPTSLASKRTQIKAMVKYHFPLTRTAVIKKTDKTNVNKIVEKLEAGGNAKWCSSFGRQSGSSSKGYT